MRRTLALSLAIAMVTSVVAATAGAGAAATTTQQRTNGETYAGSTVEFAVTGTGVVDYTVDGEPTFSAVSVQSKREAAGHGNVSGGNVSDGTGIGGDVGLDAAAEIDGAAVSASAETETRARIEAESGATITAHDTERGQLVVDAGGEEQLVRADLAADAEASTEGDAVVVESGDREGAFVVVGEGDVTVTDDGTVAAELGSDATLAFRSYADERDEQAQREEQLIADGQAAAEIHVATDGGETVTEAVSYGAETTAEASAAAENRVELTVDRAVGEGTIVLTSVSGATVDSLENVSVTVDGEAAAEASSQSALEAAASGNGPAYMVATEGQAAAEASVYVAFDHFSERTATIEGASQDGPGGNGSSGAETGDEESDELVTDDPNESAERSEESPGFGVVVAVAALLGAAAIRLRE